MKSLDIVFPEARTVALVESDVPEPGEGEVRCRARTSLVSTGTESFCLDGVFDPGTFWEEWVEYPFAPGYSMVSDVVDVGPGVTHLTTGDRVATSTPHSSVFVVPATECLRVPDGVTDDQACWTSLACTTQLGVRRVGLELGESVAVVGLGALGQLVVRYLALSGARRIVAIDTTRSRLDLAVAGGATHPIEADATAALDIVREITDGRMLEAAFDITGHPAVLAPTTRLVHALGRVVLLGDTPTPSRQSLGPRIVADSVSILGVHASSAPEVATWRDPWSQAAMADLFFHLVESGRMDLDELTTHRYTPDRAAEVYDDLRRDRSGFLGVFLDWDRGTR